MHLRVPLFVVLGHEGCGAVQAAVAEKFHGARQRSRIALPLKNIAPALEALDRKLSPEALLGAAVEANVRRTIRQVLATPEGKARTAPGRHQVGRCRLRPGFRPRAVSAVGRQHRFAGSFCLCS